MSELPPGPLRSTHATMIPLAPSVTTTGASCDAGSVHTGVPPEIESALQSACAGRGKSATARIASRTVRGRGSMTADLLLEEGGGRLSESEARLLPGGIFRPPCAPRKGAR